METWNDDIDLVSALMRCTEEGKSFLPETSKLQVDALDAALRCVKPYLRKIHTFRCCSRNTATILMEICWNGLTGLQK